MFICIGSLQGHQQFLTNSEVVHQERGTTECSLHLRMLHLFPPGSFSHLGIFPGALLSTCGASCTLAGSGRSVFLSLPTSGSGRAGTIDSKDDEAEGANGLDKHLAINKSAAEGETAELSRSDFR